MRAAEGKLRGAGPVILVLAGGLLLPAACFFPEYTFDLQKGGGGTTSSTTTTTSSTGGTGGVTTTSSSTATGGTGTTSTSSSSSSTTAPDCSSKDCSDPACKAAGYVCLGDPPTGWQGYFAIYDGPAAGTPTCGGDYPTKSFLGNADLSASPATCSKCNCAAPTGATCTVPAAFDVADAACNGNPTCGAHLPTNWAAPCVISAQSQYVQGGVATCGQQADTTCSSGTAACNQSIIVPAATVTGGSCSASQVQVTKPQTTWQAVGEACGGLTAGATGCNTGQQCIPRPPDGFEATTCISAPGAVDCPAGLFQKQHIFYTKVADTRDCSPCSCGSASGLSCSATITVYASTTGCTGTPITTINIDSTTGSCGDLTGNPTVGSRKAVITGPSGGSCTATGGTPTGAAVADPATAVTYCCL